MPATLKRQTRPEAARPRPSAPRSGEGSKMSEDRAAYRKGPGAPDKKADVGAGSAEIDFVRKHFLWNLFGFCAELIAPTIN